MPAPSSAASKAMEDWMANRELLEADADAEYAAVIDIDLADIKEPILACPNDPDDASPLSEVSQGEKIDEVFIGSCMTNIGHFPCRRQAAGCARPAADPPVDGPADQDGRRAA